jgi:hypothetical protein
MCCRVSLLLDRKTKTLSPAKVRALVKENLGPGTQYPNTPELRRVARRVALAGSKPSREIIDCYAEPFLMGQTLSIGFGEILTFVRADAIGRSVLMRHAQGDEIAVCSTPDTSNAIELDRKSYQTEDCRSQRVHPRESGSLAAAGLARRLARGCRQNDIYEQMRGIASKLSVDEMHAVASYYGTPARGHACR